MNICTNYNLNGDSDSCQDLFLRGDEKEMILLRACSVSSQSMWIEWDWMGLKPKQVKPLLIFFQSYPIHVFWE
jgi:hypothetical protein